MLFLKEVFDIGILEERVVELNENVTGIDAMSTRLDGLSIKELIFRIDSLKERAAQPNRLESRGSS